MPGLDVVIRIALKPAAETHYEIIPRLHVLLSDPNSSQMLRGCYAKALDRLGLCEDAVIGILTSLTGDEGHFALQVLIPPWHKLQMWRFTRLTFKDIKEVLR